MSRKYVLGLDLGTTLGVSQVFVDGGVEAVSLELDSNIQGRTTGVAGVIKRHATPDCLGVCIEDAILPAILVRQGSRSDAGCRGAGL
ncbi:hypothetical protein HL666_11360 [Bradyrhizobium sp. 83002]|uniref:hypothetical protein n=1 Tax=Bradyrhizobium aeschynomenes TaxID=2734909 RepID=UPI00155559E1|nr:hypothetical protein [Bradyrhizobium aeschynomenes]NPU11365.1 hypothetical protein [Bradyrhizobium aeschynomenes]